MTIYHQRVWIIFAYLTIFSDGVFLASIDRHGKSILELFNVVRLNPASRLIIGVQITLPISTFMPDLGLIGRQSRARSSSLMDYTWITAPPSNHYMCPSERVSLNDYLQLLQIDLEPCKERFLCELASNPERFTPLSDILLKKLAFNAENLKRGHTTNSSFNSFLQAAYVGVNPEKNCATTYWECPVSASEMINMNLLWGFQVLIKLGNIKFVGELDGPSVDL